MSIRTIARTWRFAEHGSGRVVVPRVIPAFSFGSRLRGLLGRRGLAAGTGLWLAPCTSVHTLGMRFAIDILFLDRQLRVLAVGAETPAWRCCLAPAGTGSVLELAGGQVSDLGIAVGLRLTATPAWSETT